MDYDHCLSASQLTCNNLICWLQGYCLVLVDCDISLVGLVLLSLLATLLTLQPQRGQWQEQAAGGSSNILPAVMRGEVRRSGGMACSFLEWCVAFKQMLHHTLKWDGVLF